MGLETSKISLGSRKWSPGVDKLSLDVANFVLPPEMGPGTSKIRPGTQETGPRASKIGPQTLKISPRTLEKCFGTSKIVPGRRKCYLFPKTWLNYWTALLNY